MALLFYRSPMGIFFLWDTRHVICQDISTLKAAIIISRNAGSVLTPNTDYIHHCNYIIQKYKGGDVTMPIDHDKASGIKSLIKKYRKLFRIPENLNHYSDEDFRKAERKFLKFSLYGYAAETSSNYDIYRKKNN